MLRILAVLLVLGGLAACDGDKNVPLDKATIDRTPDQGILAFVHAIPDAPQLTVAYSGSRGTRVARTLTYGEGFTAATIISTYVVRIGYLDADGDLQTVLELDGADSIELAEDDHFTLVLTGSLAAPEIVRIDNEEYLFGVRFDTPASVVGEPEINFAHFAAGEPPLDFFLTDAGAALADATPTASLAFGAFSELQEVEPGTAYRLRITPQGDRTTVLHDSGAFPIAATTRRLHTAFNDFGPAANRVRARLLGSAMISYPNENRPTELRVANLVADVPEIDIYLDTTDGAPIRTGVDFNQVTAFEQREPVADDILVTPAGVKTPVLFTGPATFLRGESNTFLVGGLRTDPDDATRGRITAGQTTDDIRPLDGLVPVRVFHGAGTAGVLNIHLLEPGESFTALSAQFPGVQLGNTGLRVFPPGERDLIVTRGTPEALAFGPERVDLAAGSLYLLTITDTAGGGPPFGIELVPTPLSRAP